MKDRPRASHVAPGFSAVFWSVHYSNWPFLVSAMARTKQTARKIQTDTQNLSWYLDNSLNLHVYENEDLEQKKEWGKVEQMAGKYLQEKGEKVNLVTFFRSGGLGLFDLGKRPILRRRRELQIAKIRQMWKFGGFAW